MIVDQRVGRLHRSGLMKRFAPFTDLTIEVPSGEGAKSERQVRRLHAALLEYGIRRDDCLVAIGGGATTDLVGYVAATVLRGIAWIAIPTTLLGMVDAAIGGKTGINHACGKNLIGAIWQPSHVIADPAWLLTLPRRELFAGAGEMLKYTALVRKGFETRLRHWLAGERRPEDPTLAALIERSVQYKLGVVAADERESGTRAFLNFGHTFAHAIESVLGYRRLRHGEAVILGCWAAIELGLRLRVTDNSTVDRYRSLCESMMSEVPAPKMNGDAILNAMRIDKKATSRGLRFVLISSPGEPMIREGVSRRDAGAAVRALLRQLRRGGGR